jgi:ankyrin repeat protein
VEWLDNLGVLPDRPSALEERRSIRYVLMSLYKKGPRLPGTLDRQLDKLLLLETINGNVSLVRNLLELGAKPNDEMLQKSISENYLPIVRLLLAYGADPTKVSIDGKSDVRLIELVESFPI